MDNKSDVARLVNKENVKRICVRVLTEYAPEEVVLVNPAVDRYFEGEATGQGVLIEPGELRDIPLGFGQGTDIVTPLLVPTVAAVISRAAMLFGARLRDAVKKLAGAKANSVQGVQFGTEFDKIKNEMTIVFSSQSLTKKQADTLALLTLRALVEVLAEETNKP